MAALAIVAAGLLVALAVTNGVLNFNLPSTSIDRDKYSEIVNRRASDTGILVPIEILITGTQEAGDNYADLDIIIKPYHEEKGSDGNYVPTPEVISNTEFNTKVGGKGNGQHYAVSGESVKNTDLALYNTTLVSKSGVSMGNSQNNYHAWSSPASPSPSLTKQNTGIYLWTLWEHHRKGTDEILESADVKLLWYVDIPAYNSDNWKWQKTYTANFFVPFTDYAVVEDIYCYIIGFSMHCDIEWRKVKTVTHSWWDFPILSEIFGQDIETCTVEDIDIDYRFFGPISYSLDNARNPWSHDYLYKIR